MAGRKLLVWGPNTGQQATSLDDPRPLGLRPTCKDAAPCATRHRDLSCHVCNRANGRAEVFHKDADAVCFRIRKHVKCKELTALPPRKGINHPDTFGSSILPQRALPQPAWIRRRDHPTGILCRATFHGFADSVFSPGTAHGPQPQVYVSGPTPMPR